MVTPKEGYKIKAIERKIRTTFTKGTIPGAKEICEIQLKKLVNKVISTEVKENDNAEFNPAVMADFEDLSKEEVIKKFVSAEFNQFIEYYNRAGDLNRKQGKDARDNDRGNDRNSDSRDRVNSRDRGDSDRGGDRDRGS